MQADQLILRERWFQNLLKNQKISSKFKSRHTMSTKQSSDSSSSDEENAPTLAQIMRSYMADEDATSTHLRVWPDSTVPVPATQQTSSRKVLILVTPDKIESKYSDIYESVIECSRTFWVQVDSIERSSDKYEWVVLLSLSLSLSFLYNLSKTSIESPKTSFFKDFGLRTSSSP